MKVVSTVIKVKCSDRARALEICRQIAELYPLAQITPLLPNQTEGGFHCYINLREMV